MKGLCSSLSSHWKRSSLATLLPALGGVWWQSLGDGSLQQVCYFLFKNWVLMQRLVLGLNAKWIILKFFFCIMWGGVRASNVKPPDFFKGTIRNCALWNSHHIAWVSHIPVLYSLSQSCFVWLDLFSRMCSWIVYTQNAHCQIYLMCQHKFWLILFFFATITYENILKTGVVRKGILCHCNACLTNLFTTKESS